MRGVQFLKFANQLANHLVAFYVVLWGVFKMTPYKTKEPPGNSKRDTQTSFITDNVCLAFGNDLALYVSNQRLQIITHETDQEHLPLLAEGFIDVFEAFGHEEFLDRIHV